MKLEQSVSPRIGGIESITLSDSEEEECLHEESQHKADISFEWPHNIDAEMGQFDFGKSSQRSRITIKF